MKQCPYCKEDIRDDASKCRYCQSPVSAEGSPAKDDRRVTYIVDSDLVRFAKFAGSVLAIFVIVGLYLFGIDVKKTAEELKEAKSVLKSSEAEVHEVAGAVDTARKELTELQTRLKKVEDEANAVMIRISQRDKEVAVFVEAMVLKLTPSQEKVIEQRRKENPGEFTQANGGVALQRAWPVGKTLRIRFLDGSPELQERIRNTANEWTKYANIKFEFGGAADAEIRITTEGEGSWSYIGTDALALPRNEPTMMLGQARNDISTVLHEFGHALGLIHEHQNPNAKIPWNKAAVYRIMAKQGWSKPMVDSQLLTAAPVAGYRPYDRDSIMHFAVSKEWTTGGFEVGNNTVLSQGDKDFIRKVYPAQ